MALLWFVEFLSSESLGLTVHTFFDYFLNDENKFVPLKPNSMNTDFEAW